MPEHATTGSHVASHTVSPVTAAGDQVARWLALTVAASTATKTLLGDDARVKASDLAISEELHLPSTG
jgi:hypothetical protein